MSNYMINDKSKIFVTYPHNPTNAIIETQHLKLCTITLMETIQTEMASLFVYMTDMDDIYNSTGTRTRTEII